MGKISLKVVCNNHIIIITFFFFFLSLYNQLYVKVAICVSGLYCVEVWVYKYMAQP